MLQPLQDLRHAVRALTQRPGLVRVVVLTMALAAGANTAVFTLVHGFLLRPVGGVEEPDRLVALSMRQPLLGIEDGDLSSADFLDFRVTCSGCAGMAAFNGRNVVLRGDQEAERVEGMEVTPGLFSLLGMRPELGRGFLTEEAQEGRDRVVILSHGLWQRRFGSDPRIVGRTMTADGQPVTVVGVMPKGFRFPETAEVWLPLTSDPAEERSNRYLDGVVARLADGVSRQQVQAELAAVAEGLAAEHPDTNAGWSLTIQPFRQALVDSGLRHALFLMQGAVFFVLLIACANVANLLLAREASRRREVALRLALGAGRLRVVGQLLLECALMAVAGGALGVLVARWSLDYVLASNPEELPYWLDFSMSWPVLAATLGLCLVASILFGLLPALRVSGSDLAGTLKEGGGQASAGRSRQRLQRALVAAEVALSVILLFGAVLLLRSFSAIVEADVGFPTERVLVMRTYLPSEPYETAQQRVALLEQAVEKVEALPGVARATFTGAVPADDGSAVAQVMAEGQIGRHGELPQATYVGSWPGFFETLGVPILAGRGFTAEEGRDEEVEVAVVNQRLAHLLWPSQQALERRLRVGEGEDSRWLTVVGVVGDLQYEEFGEETLASRLQIHLPYAVVPWRPLALMVRTDGDPAALAPTVRRALTSVGPALPVWDVRSMDEVLRYTTWGQRILGEVFGYFALIALLLGALGIYGVMAYAVAQRLHEIGIRLALGADAPAVVRLVLRGGLLPAALGWIAGLAGALAVARLMEAMLWSVTPTDPPSILLVSVTIVTVTLLAAYLPARRAARVPPTLALRGE